MSGACMNIKPVYFLLISLLLFKVDIKSRYKWCGTKIFYFCAKIQCSGYVKLQHSKSVHQWLISYKMMQNKILVPSSPRSKSLSTLMLAQRLQVRSTACSNHMWHSWTSLRGQKSKWTNSILETCSCNTFEHIFLTQRDCRFVPHHLRWSVRTAEVITASKTCLKAHIVPWLLL